MERSRWQHFLIDARVAQSVRQKFQIRRRADLVATREAARVAERRLLVCARVCRVWTWPGWTLSVRRRKVLGPRAVVRAALVEGLEGPEGWWTRRGRLLLERSCASWALMTPFAKGYIIV